MLSLHDSLAPEFQPQHRGFPLRYYTQAAAAAGLLRQAECFEPIMVVLPEPANATLAASAVYEARVSHIPFSFIVGFTGSSQRTAGFEVRIEESASKALVFSRAIKYGNLVGGTSGPPYSLQYTLPLPRLILEPGVLSVRLRNLDSANSNAVQLIMMVVQPCQV